MAALVVTMLFPLVLLALLLVMERVEQPLRRAATADALADFQDEQTGAPAGAPPPAGSARRLRLARLVPGLSR